MKSLAAKTGKSTETSTDAKGGLRETLSTVGWALAIAIVLRTFIFQAFTIPTGSMYPGLMVGDYIITSKYSVGYGRHAAAPLPFPNVDGRLFGRGPERGDVIVFRPEGSSENYIKRVIGFAGEQIQLVGGDLYIDGRKVERDPVGTEIYGHFENGRVADRIEVTRYAERLPGADGTHDIYDAFENGTYDTTTVFTVPPGHLFVMGDNRDFSLDGRVPVSGGGAGYVPEENVIGRAEFILASVDEDFTLFKPWTWANFRGDRFFKGIE